MTNPPSSNYIKVKSRRRVKRENEESHLRKTKAGTMYEMPGKAHLQSPIRSITGISMPQSFVPTEVDFGETLTTRSAGTGKGTVHMPPEQARPILTSHMQIYPWSFTQRWRAWGKLADSPLSDIDRPYVQAGAIWCNPSATTGPGSMHKELERTSGPDSNRIKRTRRREKIHKRDFK